MFFLVYMLGVVVTYIGLVVFNKDSLISRDVTDNVELYVIMIALSLMFPITLALMLTIFSTQQILELFEGRKKNEKV